MHELPGNFNKLLPSHKVRLTNGTLQEIECRGGEVRSISTDAGLFYGMCGGCAELFVYMFRSNEWIREDAFEALIRSNSDEIGKTLKSL